jgi:opacity protein-like surface antigen
MKRVMLGILLLFICQFSSAQEGKWAIGPHLTFSVPQAEFANVSSLGEGIGGKLFYRFESMPVLEARLDIIYLSYGEKRNRQSLAIGYFPVTIRNESFQFTAGPQLVTNIGRFRPYFAPMGGLYVYRSVMSSPELYYYYGIPASETTESYTNWGWNLSAGLMFDLTIGAHIDLGFKYQRITNAVENQIGETKITSDAEDFIITLGAVFFLND